MLLAESISEYIKEKKEPSILTEFRTNAEKLLNSAIFPDSSLESWRKISLSNFKISEYTKVCPDSSVTVSGNAKVTRLQDLPPEKLSEVLKKVGPAVSFYSKEWFPLFVFSRFTHAYYVQLGSDPSSYPEIKIECKDGNIILPLLIVDAFPGAKSNFIERWESPDQKDLVLMSGVTILLTPPNGDFQYSSLENLGDSTFHFRATYGIQEKDSKFHASLASWGGYKGKTFYDTNVVGKGCWTRYVGLSPLKAREFQDTEVRILHSESHAQSSILYRTVVREKAHHVFTGNLHIPSHCKDVGAIQINNNLLLDRTARAESIPKLEVFADSVKCEHGATVGEIDEEQLFYLASRGISEEEARKMIVEGFLNEVVREFPSETVREELSSMIESRMLGE
ncbi:SufD family Fe-S cluster assembly protein [Leptospira selangorensis]|uniref:SufD family Fe-S cluster assembly protein n=1 Tax=Leptospira selangorensis TaxID=2484982 RepID=A0A5F2C6T6_9LEPT|nr:SufD family Fe-S cluster assembly protein [Leptospira selangorensis]TGM12763.1 SufD family Fe-S cluster assembly protein [Leptospira selangorensis]TGM30824.1 SufD family Fe-S cluster assembly protein [Leptospira selangorensis]